MKPVCQKQTFKTKSLILGLSLFLVLSFSLLKTKAGAQSPEATPTANEEVEEIRDAVKEKVREKVEAAKAGEKRALVGELAEVFNNTLVLTTRLGEHRAQVATDAAIISQGKTITFEGLEIGTNLICMGYLRPDEILDARRVVVEEIKKAAPEKTVVFGEIDKIDEEEEIIFVKYVQSETVWEVITTTKTDLTKKVENEIEEADFDDFSLGDRVVAIGTQTGDKNELTASLIYSLASFTEQLEPTPTPTETEETPEE